MARRGSFTSLINQIARESAKKEREKVRLEKTKIREAERSRKLEIKLSAQADKEAKQKYLESRLQEVEDLNNDLSLRIEELKGVLGKTLEVDDSISFDSLKITEDFPTFELPNELQKEPIITKEEDFLSKIPKPSSLEKLIPGWEKRHQTHIENELKRFREYEAKIEIFLTERNKRISELQSEYSKEKEGFEQKKQQRNQEVEELENSYKNGEPHAISSYCTMVLERSEYPEEFPQEFRVAYVPEPKELIVEYELPHKDIIPSASEYKYVKSKDTVEEKPRKSSEVKDLYQDVVSAVCLRTIHELFEANQENQIDVIVFNGFVNDIDPATGKDVRPCIVSVRTTKDKFTEINLAKVDKKACLRNLGAKSRLALMN